jgi:hypothetical protein
MAKTTIYRTYNIPEAIIAEAERQGLDAMATGGNMDYIFKALGKNEDGSPRILLLCNANDAGSPDRLSDKVDVQVMLCEDWTQAVAIPVRTAKEGMALMKSMYDPYKG